MVGEQTYWAETFSCVMPACDCDEAIITFFTMTDRPGPRVAEVTTALGDRDAVKVLRIEPEAGAPASLAAELWERFCLRHHGGGRYLRRRNARMKQAGPAIHEAWKQREPQQTR